MDRNALSKRLEGLSSVFADGNPIKKDLGAMAYVLANMSDEKFAQILNPEYNADTDAAMAFPVAPPARSRGPKLPQILKERGDDQPPVFEPRNPARGIMEGIMRDPKKLQDFVNDPAVAQALKKQQVKVADEEQPEAAEKTEQSENAGLFWSKDASDAVLNNLVRDVTGMDKSICCDTKRHLTPEEMPDGKHAGVPEKPASLKPEQTPNQVDVLDSNIVAESNKTPLKKEAGSKMGPGIPDGTGPNAGTPACQMKKDEEKEEKKEKESAEEIEIKVEAPEKEEEEKKEEKEATEESAEHNTEEPKEATEENVEEKSAEQIVKEAGDTMLVSEGIELIAPMEDVELSDVDSAKLNKLFE